MKSVSLAARGADCLRWFQRIAALAIVLSLAPALRAGTRTTGTLARGTRWETPYHVQQCDKAGPTVVLVGGVHGNEPAGAAAADQVRQWPIARGRLVVLPRANVPALAAGKRRTPGAARAEADLNRNFPRAGKREPPRGELAAAIWKSVARHKPDWLVDLHEGSDFHQINPESVGSSVIVNPSPAADKAAALVLAAVNDTIPDKDKQFVRLRPPKGGSLARAAGEHLGAHALILETTIKGQPRSRRTRQHRIMLHRLLAHLEMIGPEVTVDWITDRSERPAPVRVALYDAEGTGGRGVPRLTAILGQNDRMRVVRVGPAGIEAGALDQFDVVIFPGGSGSRQAHALGAKGRAKVRAMLDRGGGYVGICAGAYLAAEGFSWGVKVLDAKTVSPKWRRGRAVLKIELTDAGRKLLGDRTGPLDCKYNCGPVFKPAGSDALPDYQALALFRTEVADNGTPAGVMTGSPAILAGRFGRGRVICISPHPEQTPGLEPLVRRAVDWASGRLSTPQAPRSPRPSTGGGPRAAWPASGGRGCPAQRAPRAEARTATGSGPGDGPGPS